MTTRRGIGAAEPAVCAERMRPRQRRKAPVVDAQVHLWKAASAEPWVPGIKPQMPEPFTIEKLVALMERPASIAFDPAASPAPSRWAR